MFFKAFKVALTIKFKGGLMKIEIFDMERMHSTWENLVEYDLSQSGIMAVTLNNLVEMGLDMKELMDMPLECSQSDGTLELKDLLCKIYPGAKRENIEVTNGTSEANYILALSQLKNGDDFALEIPNYMQLWGVPRSLGVNVKTFSLNVEDNWEPNWDEFEKAVNPNTRMVYISNPNNPTGSILSDAACERIVKRCEEMDCYLLSDEVYLGAELEKERTKSFWGMSDKVIVTSGLSKAYGIPGVRIGWIIGPKEVVYDCWTQHDYITIGPNKISDRITRIAVKEENRDKLFNRTRYVLQKNIKIFREWAAEFGDFFTFKEPEAGAICFLKYKADIPGVKLCERILKNKNTLIVPGSYLGMESYIRIWLGCSDEAKWCEGLKRIKEEIKAIM
jgi:hypothetical protein